MVELVLLHNGKTQGILEHRYVGSTDEPLCAEGIAELRERLDAGFYPTLSAICSSPMRRCTETAALLYPNLTPTVMQGFRPKGYGWYELKSYTDLKDDKPYQDWVRSIGKLPFPDGDPEELCNTRYLAAFDELTTQLRASVDPKRAFRIGIVLHRDVIATILVERLPVRENALKYHLKNGEFFKIALTPDGIELIGKNVV